MISVLSGTVKKVDAQLLTLEVANIGFAVSVPNESLFLVDQKLELQINFLWNQEKGPQLFGFISTLEKQVFNLIISCSGLGPKIGLLILAQISAEEFIELITLADVDSLSNINGLGTKKAEILVMQLKNKVSKIVPNIQADLNSNSSSRSLSIKKVKDLSEALSSLNYSKQEINLTVDHIKKQNDLSSISFDQILRKSLAFLAKKV